MALPLEMESLRPAPKGTLALGLQAAVVRDDPSVEAGIAALEVVVASFAGLVEALVPSETGWPEVASLGI